MDLARAILQKMKGRSRKDIIDAFIEEAQLTRDGAQTYYYKLRGEAKASPR
jgi:hypothetical protein